jgi:hypothetical protein
MTVVVELGNNLTNLLYAALIVLAVFGVRRWR